MTSMTVKQLLIGALSVVAIAGIAGCGGSSSGSTPTASNGGFSLPSIPGLTTNSGKPAPDANTLLSASDVQNVSGDANVAPVSGACSASTCIYSDTGSGGGGGVIFVQPFPGFVGQAALQAAIAAALSGQASSSGGTAQAVSGLGSGPSRRSIRELCDLCFCQEQLPRRDQCHLGYQVRGRHGFPGRGCGA